MCRTEASQSEGRERGARRHTAPNHHTEHPPAPQHSHDYHRDRDRGARRADRPRATADTPRPSPRRSTSRSCARLTSRRDAAEQAGTRSSTSTRPRPGAAAPRTNSSGATTGGQYHTRGHPAVSEPQPITAARAVQAPTAAAALAKRRSGSASPEACWRSRHRRHRQPHPPHRARAHRRVAPPPWGAGHHTGTLGPRRCHRPTLEPRRGGGTQPSTRGPPGRWSSETREATPARLNEPDAELLQRVTTEGRDSNPPGPSPADGFQDEWPEAVLGSV